jgi:hypothetical protein
MAMAAGSVPGWKSFEDLSMQRDELTRRHFEPQLTRIGLSAEQIEHQNLEELNQSLVKIDEAIAHPEAFGTLHLKISGEVGLVLTTARQEAHMEVNVLPLLLERKSLILARVRSLAGDKRVESLNDLVATVTDPDLRAKIEGELSVLAKQSKRLAEQESKVVQAQAEQIAVARRDEAEALAMLQTKLFERRLRAWTGFFARESMATYVGAFLLVVLTFVQVGAMFSSNLHTTEIVNNAFLLILGYFFGQSVARTPSSAGQEGL